MTRKVMRTSESRVIATEMIMPDMANAHGTLYGGNLMHKLDNVASISFQRHTRGNGVTASMDNLNFISPLPISHSVSIETFVTGTGNSSVEVFGKVVGEDLKTGKRYLAATAFLTFVVLPDENGTKPQVADIEGETDEERFVIAGYSARRAERLEERKEDQEFQKHITIDMPHIS